MKSELKVASSSGRRHTLEAIGPELYPPERRDSAHFGTLSFPVFNNAADDHAQMIAEILKRRHPALMLRAGWSVIGRRALKTIEEATKRVSSVVLVETSAQRPQNYRIAAGKAVLMGPQFFGSRDDRTGQAVRAMEGAVANREFRFDKHSALHNQRALLLACGEIGVVSGRTNVDYHEFVGSSINLRDAIKNANIILNPIHTRIADRGVLLAKRAFLSKNRRVYLSASNWDKRGERTQHISPTIHSLWYNGREKTCDSCFESDRFCYREWNAVG